MGFMDLRGRQCRLLLQQRFMQIFQCRPVSFQWDQSRPGTCWNLRIMVVWGIINGGGFNLSPRECPASRLTYDLAVGAATDFAFALIPWYYVRSLQMSLKNKLGVGVALSLGFFAGGCSIVKTCYIPRMGEAQADYSCKFFEDLHVFRKPKLTCAQMTSLS